MVEKKAFEVRRFVEGALPAQGIFLAYGPDAGLVSETGRVVSRKLAGKGASADSVVTFEAMELESDPGRVTVEARTPSLFGDKRVLRVRGVPKGFAAVVADLADDLGDISLVIEAGDLSKKDPLRVFVEQCPVAWTLPCYPDNEEAVRELVTTTLREAEVSADSTTIAAICAHLGNDREVTRRELEKLVTYAGDGGTLDAGDVAVLLGDNGGLTIDNIIDAVATGRAADLDAAYTYAEANGADVQQILAIALNHFRNLRRWRADVDAGTPVDKVLLAVVYPRRKAVGAQLRLWRDADLQALLERLQRAIADTRKNYDLRKTICARELLGICQSAARR